MLDIRRTRENSDGGQGARSKMADEEVQQMALQDELFRRALHICRGRIRLGNLAIDFQFRNIETKYKYK